MLIDLSLRQHGLDHLIYVFVGFVVALRIFVFEVEAHIASSLMPQLEGIGSLF